MEGVDSVGADSIRWISRDSCPRVKSDEDFAAVLFFLRFLKKTADPVDGWGRLGRLLEAI
jgi:hypothetical protein